VRYGVTLGLYVDWKYLYKRLATVREQLRGEEPMRNLGTSGQPVSLEREYLAEHNERFARASRS